MPLLVLSIFPCMNFYINGRSEPKVVNNCSTINDFFGAIAAVAETQEDFRFVLKRGIQEREDLGLDTPVNGCPIPLNFRIGVFILLMRPL
jgi:hypothetical protein